MVTKAKDKKTTPELRKAMPGFTVPAKPKAKAPVKAKATAASAKTETPEERAFRLKGKEIAQKYRDRFTGSDATRNDEYYRILYGMSSTKEMTKSLLYKMQEKFRVEGEGRSIARPVTTSDITLCSLLDFISKEGYDISGIRFDKYGAVMPKSITKKD